MELDEYTRHDAIGLRELIAAGEVTAEEVEAVARRALDPANAEVNGLASPPFSPRSTTRPRATRGRAVPVQGLRADGEACRSSAAAAPFPASVPTMTAT